MMIPLSYSCIFGGTCTIVGTSTNLIVVGLVAGRDPTLQFPFFEVCFSRTQRAL
jgi:Na+/H+ antiporter NhaD/arsenite permease-like protein